MGAADDKFRREWRSPGYLYIALSPSTKLLKIGITADPKNARTARLWREGYGGITDWMLLYRRQFKDAGRIEHNVKMRLSSYQKVVSFTRKGETRVREARELFKCSYGVAKKAIESQGAEALDKRCWEWPTLEKVLRRMSAEGNEST